MNDNDNDIFKSIIPSKLFLWFCFTLLLFGTFVIALTNEEWINGHDKMQSGSAPIIFFMGMVSGFLSSGLHLRRKIRKLKKQY